MKYLIFMMLLALTSCHTSKVTYKESISTRDTVINVSLPSEKVTERFLLKNELGIITPRKIEIGTSVAKVIVDIDEEDVVVTLQNKDSIAVTSKITEIEKTTERVIVKKQFPTQVIIIFVVTIIVLVLILKIRA